MRPNPNSRLLALLFVSFAFVFIWSGIRPHDYFTWILEVTPAFAGALLLAWTFKRFPLTTVSYVHIWIFALILCIGGHYTYAEVPFFNWLSDIFDLGRNHFDRLGHFFQGFVPAITAREVLLRTSPLKRGKWLFFIAICIALAISGFYEIIEYLTARFTGEAAEAFLGTQGDPWDTQRDMFMALLGAVHGCVIFKRLQDRQLNPPSCD